MADPDRRDMTGQVTIGSVRAAADRLAGRLRRTPLVRAAHLRERFHDGELLLKLECLQATGSFKPRGALNRVLTLSGPSNGVVTASGGNHGLGVAFAAAEAGVPATVYVPTSTPEPKVGKIRRWGAAVEVVGEVYDEAEEAARLFAEREGAAYVHAFADPEVIAGQGTLGLELLEEASGADTALVAVGGGGLIGGVALALKAVRPGMRVVGVEPTGAPTLHRSLAAGHPVTLDRIETGAGTLAPRRTTALNLALAEAWVDETVLVEDAEMRSAARWLWFEMGVAAELAGAAAAAALMTGRYRPRPGERVVAVVCGAGTDGTG